MICNIGDTMKQQIVKILKQYTDVFGFVSTKTYKEERSKLKRNDNFDNYHFLDGYQTIITLGFPHPSKQEKWKKKGYGLLARFSYGTDYHVVIMEKLNRILKEFNELDIDGFCNVDISSIDEKYAAYLSGIGYFGKNSLIIHPKYGSYLYLGTITINQDININHSLLNSECGSCTKCIHACPSSALNDGFERSLCISELSQSKVPFTTKEISYFKTMIYGCDICQKVCPKNSGIDFHLFPEFEPNGKENISIASVLDMSNKTFKEDFKDNTCHWIGAARMKRNALCLIANQKLSDLKPKIAESMDVYQDNLWYNKTAEIVLKMLESE